MILLDHVDSYSDFCSIFMVQLEQNRDIAYNAFLGQFKQFE